MITALNPATIGGEPPLIEYIALAEKHGFGGIEFGIERLCLLAQETSLNNVRSAFEQFGVQPAVFGLPIEWRKDDASFSEGLAKLPEFARRASDVGCSRTGTWLPPAISGSPDDFRELIIKRFRAIAEIIADHGIRLALEYVGPETLRTGPSAMGTTPFIYNLPLTLDLIERIGAPADNVGLLVDSFHWYTSKSTIADLLGLTANQVVHVHINDAPDRPVEEQIDFERLLPGDGIIDLKGFLRSLAQIGYDGFVAVETFNKELAAKGQEQAAQLTEDATERLLASL